MPCGLPVIRHLSRHFTHSLPEGRELVYQDPGVAVELTDLPPLAPLANLDSPIHTHSPLSRPQEVRMACRLPQPPHLTLFTPYTTYPTCATQAPLGLLRPKIIRDLQDHQGRLQGPQN